MKKRAIPIAMSMLCPLVYDPASSWQKGLRRQQSQKSFTMRLHLIPLLVILALVQLRTGVFAQNITLEKRNVTIGQVFKEIEKQSGHVFFYKKAELDRTERISVELRNVDLESAVSKVLKGRGFDFKIINKTIVLRKTEQKPTTEIQNKVSDLPDVPKTVHGTISDTTGAALPGVSVLVKGTTLGTITDRNGSYELSNVGSDAVLRFSMIGFTTQELAVKGRNNVSTTLHESNLKLDEVSVISTGYQVLPKERVTGSFAFVDNKLYNRQVSTDVISRLKAIAPSLLFDERSGNTKLNIRGTSTIFANNQPLIVVDNFPYDGDIRNINPNDVENITILRDAAAASIWGVRAGNGVIVITTKSGTFNSRPKITINTNMTVGNKPDLFYLPRISSSDYIDIEQFLFEKGKYNADLSNTTSYPVISPVVEILSRKRSGALSENEANQQIDALKDVDVRNDMNRYFYQKSYNQQYAINFQGGSSHHSYYVSSGFDKSRANLAGNDYSRLNLNARNTLTPIKNLVLTFGLNYTRGVSSFNNVVSEELRLLYPYSRLADGDGNALPVPRKFRMSFAEKAINTGLLDWTYAPLTDLRLSDNKQNSTDIRFNSGLRFIFLKGFSADVKYQYEKQFRDTRTYQGVESFYTRDLINSFTQKSPTTGLVNNIPVGDILTVTNNNVTAGNGRLQLNYANKWKRNDVSFLAGFEAREVLGESYGSKYYGYYKQTGTNIPVNYNTIYSLNPTGTGNIPRPPGMGKTTDRFRSFFLNGSYTYNNRYTLSASARRDESNLFGVKANQKGVPLWSTGLSWDITNEHFRPTQFSYLKLRATYGYNGNFDNTVTAYPTGTYYSAAYITSLPYAALYTPANPSLTWERIGVLNTGLDFEFKHGIISGSLDYYWKKGRDLIGNGPIDPTTGYSNFKGNLAAMKGNGFDIELRSKNLNNANFKWHTNFIASFNADKITKYNNTFSVGNYFIDGSILTGSSLSPTVGKPLYGIYSYRWAGLDPKNGNPRGYLNGEPSDNYSKLISSPFDSLVFHGRATPAFYGAVRNTFEYKGISLSLNITYRFGYYFRRSSINYSDVVSGNNIGHSDYALRWQNPGDENITSVPSMVYPNNSSRDSFYARSENLVEKGDNIRLQDIQLSFDLDKIGTFFKAGQLYLYASNLGILWRKNKHGIDPDYVSIMPVPKSYSIGIRFNL